MRARLRSIHGLFVAAMLVGSSGCEDDPHDLDHLKDAGQHDAADVETPLPDAGAVTPDAASDEDAG